MFKLNSRKAKVAFLSIVSNTALILMKIIAGILSGSVSIISEAIHSSMDLLASFIAFYSVNVSSKPADKGHPYGHGKIENISGVIEGVLIFLAAFLIIKEAIKKLIYPAVITEFYTAIAVMLISAIANFFISRILHKVAKEEDSVALEADALHLKTDVYTSLGVAVGLSLIKITGIEFLDPIVAICVACLIIKEAFSLCRRAFGPLIDSCLSEEEEEKIQNVIKEYEEKVVEYNKLRARRSGQYKLIDFTIIVPEQLTLKEAHEISEEIEKKIEEAIHNTDILIHIEPEKAKTFSATFFS
ncbi:MAG TPA: cation diffusion facilitator family transporter [Anaerovoracaceae bacterium]|nr:cation diffusion facilitator family transporter [Anaerovoracaceae bacterium]